MITKHSAFTSAIALITIAVFLAEGCGQHRRNQASVPALVSTQIGWIRHNYYSGPPPRHPSALQPGQQFLCLPDTASSPLDFHDAATGQTIAAHSLGLRILTLLKVASPVSGSPARLTFGVEGSSLKLTLASSAPVDKLAGLIPLADDNGNGAADAALDHLRRAYEGRFVWCYGGDGSIAVTDSSAYSAYVSTPLLLPTRVRRIVRIDRTGVPMNIGQQQNVVSDTIQTNAFTDDYPLVVIFDIPNAECDFMLNADASDFGPLAPPIPQWTPTTAVQLLPQFPPRPTLDEPVPPTTPKQVKTHVLGSYIVLADTWDFDRRYSLRSPRAQHPDWSSRTLYQLSHGEIQTGMTRDMVAWKRGYGNGYGTLSHLRRADAWTYDDLKPWFITISFNKRGRVNNIDMPTLP